MRSIYGYALHFVGAGFSLPNSCCEGNVVQLHEHQGSLLTPAVSCRLPQTADTANPASSHGSLRLASSKGGFGRLLGGSTSTAVEWKETCTALKAPLAWR